MMLRKSNSSQENRYSSPQKELDTNNISSQLLALIMEAEVEGTLFFRDEHDQ